MRKHFLTIRRYIEHTDIIEDCEYYYDEMNPSIWCHYVYRNPYNFFIEKTGKERAKELSLLNFIFNLTELEKHPGKIFEDDDFIIWYCERIEQDDLRPHS